MNSLLKFGWTGKFHTFRKWSILWYILIDLDELSILFDGRSFLTNIFIFFWSYFCNLIKKDTFTNVSHIPLHVPIFLMKNWTSDRRDLLINIFWFKWTKKDSGYSSFYCVHFKLLLIYFVWRFLFQILIHLWMDINRVCFNIVYWLFSELLMFIRWP